MQVVLALTVREGRWTIHIHRAHPPEIKPHVHVSARRRGGKYSWNINGSRHDEHKFPTSEEANKAAKRIAAKYLGVPEMRLSFLTRLAGVHQITVSIEGDASNHSADIVVTGVEPDEPLEALLLLTSA
jgi:hypothetical protein